MKKTKEDYVAQARSVWGDRYVYTNSNYIDNKKPIYIYCPKHDMEFRVEMAQNHILKPNGTFRPTGCPVCEYERKYGAEYGTDWRDHLQLCAKNNRVGKKPAQKQTEEEKVRLAAERQQQREAEHQQRWQAYQRRLAEQKAETQRRHEAERAERKRQREEQERQRISDLQDMFLREAPKAQGEGYQYRGVEKITATTSRVDVHCPNPDHQWHPMRVDLILQGCKCRECAGRHQTVEQRRSLFLKNFQRKHGTNHYSVTADDYVNNDTPIRVHCNIHHYDFETTPDTLLRGGGGCPYCTASEGEATILGWLDNHHIDHTWHYQLPNTDPTLPLQYIEADFYLPDIDGHQMIIEYHGEQHYEDVPHFYKGKKLRNFKLQQHRDRYLRRYCEEQGITLLEIPYWDLQRIDEILSQTFL